MSKIKKFKTTYKNKIKTKKNNNKKQNLKNNKKKIEFIEVSLLDKIKKMFKNKKLNEKDLLEKFESFYKKDKNELINQLNLELSKKDSKKLRSNASCKKCFEICKELYK